MSEELFAKALELSYEVHISNPHIYSHTLAVAALALRYQREEWDCYLVATIGLLHHVLNEGVEIEDIYPLFGDAITQALIDLREDISKDRIPNLCNVLAESNQLVIWISFLDKLAELREYHHRFEDGRRYIAYRDLLIIYRNVVPAYLLDEMTFLIESLIES